MNTANLPAEVDKTVMAFLVGSSAARGGLSIFDPVFFGVDEFGHPVYVPMMYRNILLGGEPGSGKSAGLNNVVAHAALSLDCRLCLIDFTDRWELHWRFDLRLCVAYMFATGLCRRHAHESW